MARKFKPLSIALLAITLGMGASVGAGHAFAQEANPA